MKHFNDFNWANFNPGDDWEINTIISSSGTFYGVNRFVVTAGGRINITKYVGDGNNFNNYGYFKIYCREAIVSGIIDASGSGYGGGGGGAGQYMYTFGNYGGSNGAAAVSGNAGGGVYPGGGGRGGQSINYPYGGIGSYWLNPSPGTWIMVAAGHGGYNTAEGNNESVFNNDIVYSGCGGGGGCGGFSVNADINNKGAGGGGGGAGGGYISIYCERFVLNGTILANNSYGGNGGDARYMTSYIPPYGKGGDGANISNQGGLRGNGSPLGFTGSNGGGGAGGGIFIGNYNKNTSYILGRNTLLATMQSLGGLGASNGGSIKIRYHGDVYKSANIQGGKFFEKTDPKVVIY